jgi:hypothetical protein
MSQPFLILAADKARAVVEEEKRQGHNRHEERAGHGRPEYDEPEVGARQRN